MKKLINLFLMSFLAVGLFSCSNDENPIENGSELQNTDKVYMQLDIQLPTSNASRSATDEEGGSNSNADLDTEPGTAAECAINTLTLALCDANHNILAVSQNGQKAIIGGKDSYTVAFTWADLNEVAGKDNLYPYVIANEGNDVGTLSIGGTIKDLHESILYNEIPSIGNGGLIMTNYDQPTTVALPAREVLKGCTTPQKAQSITDPSKPIKIERAYARFDYAPKNVNNTYTIGTDASSSASSGDALTGSLNTALFEIQLTDMLPTNISKDFYYLRRVSDDGLDKNLSIGGVETPTNYVVDFNAAAKASWTNSNAENWNLLSKFHVKKAASNNVNYISLAVTSSSPQDQWQNNTGNGLEYYPKFYMTENTMAQGVANPEIPTTIVFKGQIQLTQAGKESAYVDRFNNSEALFVYQDHLYLDWEHVKTAAEAKGTDGTTPLDANLASAYQNVETKKASKTAEEMNQLYKDSGFKVFAKNRGDISVGIWYYYVNKHNDKFTNEERVNRPMEYAVVRNNVYKLAVTKIMKFGHPEDSSVDPDPIDPFKEDVYISVSLYVVPWTVRVNNIEF